MNATELRTGMRVLVHYDSEHRASKEAIVIKTPPYIEKICGEEREVTESVMVQYPNTSLDGGGFFADMSEAISLDMVELVD